MVFNLTSINPRPRRRAGFTLIEVLIASTIGLLFIAAFASMYLFSAQSFRALQNYESLHSDNRHSMDTLTSDIRSARRVVSAEINTLVLEDSDGTAISYSYSPLHRTLTRTSKGVSRILLIECDQLIFRLGQRNPIGGSYDVFPAATPVNAKVIDVSWSCSRQGAGVNLNTESVQTARIVIRKQGV
jgi:prepilin-type N-terminal cleavage/methylation domain-containing protein